MSYITAERLGKVLIWAWNKYVIIYHSYRKTSNMEQRITSLLLPAPEAELEASCKELDSRVTWLLHNNRKMDNYLELETFNIQQGRTSVRLRVRHAPKPAGNPDTGGIQGLQGYHCPAWHIHHALCHLGRTGGTTPQTGRHPRTDRLLRCPPLDATGTAIPLQRVQHDMLRLSPAAAQSGEGQRAAGVGKGAAPRRTDVAGTWQADIHRDGAPEGVQGL